jgi:hypothetical protein
LAESLLQAQQQQSEVEEEKEEKEEESEDKERRRADGLHSHGAMADRHGSERKLRNPRMHRQQAKKTIYIYTLKYA